MDLSSLYETIQRIWGFAIILIILQFLIFLSAFSNPKKEAESLQKPWVKIALWSIGLYAVALTCWVAYSINFGG